MPQFQYKKYILRLFSWYEPRLPTTFNKWKLEIQKLVKKLKVVIIITIKIWMVLIPLKRSFHRAAKLDSRRAHLRPNQYSKFLATSKAHYWFPIFLIWGKKIKKTRYFGLQIWSSKAYQRSFNNNGIWSFTDSNSWFRNSTSMSTR